MEYRVLGIMSGSSLDGLDVCLTKFISTDGSWQFVIEKAETLEIPYTIQQELMKADQMSSLELLRLDVTYGVWIGDTVNKWIGEDSETELIGIHGHTVFHDPAQGISLQIGSGQQISVITGVPTIDNFRQKDIMLGGQGAPLVPFGEVHLFADYREFVNLGGIANVSTHYDKIMAWDVAPCNQVLNYFSKMLGKPYDAGGAFARFGTLDESWLNYLRGISYFSQKPPKSLSNQWTKNVLTYAPENTADALHTYTVFLAELIAKTFESSQSEIFFTGGGTSNAFLMEKIGQTLGDSKRVIIPEEELIDFKEALIFGFLGLKRILQEPNIYSTVTGASADSVSGSLHYPL